MLPLSCIYECFPPPLGVYPVITAKQSHAEIVVIVSMKPFPHPMVIIMLKWLSNILSKEIFTRKPKIRCHVCFLPATHNLRIISCEFDSVEESEIIITICSGCNEEIHERYNS